MFAHRPVKGPRPSEIVEWLNGPMAPYSASVRQTAFFLLRGTFDLAVADKLRRDNPARSPIVQTPDSAELKPRVLWDIATVWKVIDEHPEPYRAIPVCEAGLGMRQSCAFGLAEDDIDFDAMTVTIGRQVVRVGGGTTSSSRSTARCGRSRCPLAWPGTCAAISRGTRRSRTRSRG